MLVSIIKNRRGSVTIEAAIIIPLIMSMCLLIFSLSIITYNHSRIQDLLNQVCVELSYDSYLFYELDITTKMQEVNGAMTRDKITISEIQEFSELIESVSLESVSESVVDNLNYKDPIEFVGSAVETMEYIDSHMDTASRIKESLIDEGIYYISSSFGRHYIEDKLTSYLREANIDIKFVIEHLELFNNDDSGVVVISYEYKLPLDLLGLASIKQENSGYLHLYSGHGNYDEKYNKDIKRSSYGSGSASDEAVEDEDGFFNKVYITENGSKYHKNPLCFHINVNAIPMIIDSVADKEPCKHCTGNLVLANGVMVFTTLTSDVYHTSPTCHAIYHNVSFMSEKEAILEGYTPCGTCSK